MKTRKFVMVILLAITAPAFSFSETTNTPAQLIELIKKAIDNYPKLKEGNEYVKLSETQHDLAKAVYMPVIEGDATYRYGKPTPSISFPVNGQTLDIQFIPANNYDFHLALTQPITDFGRSQVNVKKALSEIQT
ncbi:MAG: TolC family protein, partial [Bacteroidota bacterium]|nr:TolC family protein [Bacteroidota bacterium]